MPLLLLLVKCQFILHHVSVTVMVIFSLAFSVVRTHFYWIYSPKVTTGPEFIQEPFVLGIMNAGTSQLMQKYLLTACCTLSLHSDIKYFNAVQ